MPKKKKSNPVRKMILDKTGATPVVNALSGKKKPQMKTKKNPVPKDTRGMTRARMPAGTSYRTPRRKKK